MQIEDLASFPASSIFNADLVIVGGGPAGLTIAREFFGSAVKVLVLESGLLEETADHAALAEVDSTGEPSTKLQNAQRQNFHGAGTRFWTPAAQPYGVRCRALGGSTHAWAGKSAAFDPIDFEARSWVPYSGWPIRHSELAPYLDRAAKVLNLGPNVYDDGLWDLIPATAPDPKLDADKLRSFFWQFARSRQDPLDIMRFGRDFLTNKADNIRVLLNATVTQIELGPDGTSVEGLRITTIDNVLSQVHTKAAVIAASGIENARLLLASHHQHANGIGNGHDIVGRFLMDHVSAEVGRFGPEAVAQISRRFGFYGVRSDGGTHMYMHGLAASPVAQERHKLLNSAVYFMQLRSPDDPWDALKRLIKRQSDRPLQDLRAVVAGTGLLARGVGTKLLNDRAMPTALKEFVVASAIRYNPNLVADEFQSRGIPHKLTGVRIDAIAEQRPDPNSRVTLSARTDRLGVPIATIDWRINDEDRRTIVRLAHLTRDAFVAAGLPSPVLEPWVAEDRPWDAVIIDMAHTVGTTRMSDDPRTGVVDKTCQVHGVSGLYVAGASVFPTSGHANPTLMIVALAIRLADTIKRTIDRGPITAAAPISNEMDAV